MKYEPLTADIEGVFERLCNLRIKLNYQVIFLGNLIITVFDDWWDPSPKRITHNREHNIYNPLTGKTANVTLIWEMTADLLILHAHLENVLDIKALILWDMEILSIIWVNDFNEVN